MNAAKNLPVRFHSVPNDSALAVRTYGRQSVDGTLEAVEDVAAAADNDFERLVILIFANFTDCHTPLFSRTACFPAVPARFKPKKISVTAADSKQECRAVPGGKHSPALGARR
jgi:hypothetical protein